MAVAMVFAHSHPAAGSATQALLVPIQACNWRKRSVAIAWDCIRFDFVVLLCRKRPSAARATSTSWTFSLWYVSLPGCSYMTLFIFVCSSNQNCECWLRLLKHLCGMQVRAA